MKKLLITIACNFIILVVINGQAIHVGFGPVWTLSKAISPIANADANFSNTTFIRTISYEHFIKSKRLSILGIYSKLPGYTYISYAYGGYQDFGGTSIGADGWNGVIIHRLDLLAAFNIVKCKRFYLKPHGGFGFQVSRKNGWGLLESPVNGPDYVQTEPIIGEAYNTFQIVPTGGIKIGFVFWKRLDIGFQVQGVYGYKPYQKLILKYKYKGVEQPDAIAASDGTGIYYTLGIGYRFAKLIK